MNLQLCPTHVELNKAALDSFLEQPVSQGLIFRIVQDAYSIGSLPSLKLEEDDDIVRSLEDFAWTLTRYLGLTASDVTGALVYLSRLKALVRLEAGKQTYMNHGLILVSMVLAFKYLNDQWLSIKDWAEYGIIDNRFRFTPAQINRMEGQILRALDWNLRITETDLLRELEPFLCPIRERLYQNYVRNFWVTVYYLEGSSASVGRTISRNIVEIP